MRRAGLERPAPAMASRSGRDFARSAYENLRLIRCRSPPAGSTRSSSTSRSSGVRGLSPNDFADLDALTARLLVLEEHYRRIARPFDWSFTRADLDRVLERIADRKPALEV